MFTFLLHISFISRDLFDYISKHTGLEVTTVKGLHKVYDTLLVETIHNKTLPIWTRQVFPGSPHLPFPISCQGGNGLERGALLPGRSQFESLSMLSLTLDYATLALRRLTAGTFLQVWTSLALGLSLQQSRSWWTIWRAGWLGTGTRNCFFTLHMETQ